MLGALLLVGEQIGAQPTVLGRRGPARARAGERAGEHLVALDAHERLGARADERHVARAQVEHVRARVHGAKHAVEVETVAVVRCREALREHDLEDVAGRDVLLGALDLRQEVLAGRVGLERHLAGHADVAELRSARSLIDAPQVAVDALERGVVREIGSAAGTDRGDDLHDAARVIERDDDVGEHEAEVRHVELVVVVARNLLERRGGLVADVADRSADEQRQPGHASHAAGIELARDDPQRIVGPLAVHAAVLDDDLVPAAGDDGTIAHAEEAVAAQAARRPRRSRAGTRARHPRRAP